jgi:hypothetical protein
VVAVDSLVAAVEAVEHLGSCSTDYDALTDRELLVGQRELARLAKLVETRQAWMAKALAHRSRPELGQQGLAKQQGFLTPDEMIQTLTGSTRKDARKMVDVGLMLADTEAADARAAEAEAEARRLLDDANRPDGADGSGGLDGPDGSDRRGGPDRPEGLDGPGGPNGPNSPPGFFDDLTPSASPSSPWFTPISRATATGALSVAAAHAIRTGLGNIDTVVTADKLAAAVQTLLDEATVMGVDELLKRSRRMRDSLDEAGIAVREKKAWDDRYLRMWKIDTGQVHIHGLFPPEQGAYLMSLHDSLTGPRRGGVRFVDPDRAAWAKAVQDDPRTTDQITADAFLQLLKAGSSVNPNRMLGGKNPAVRILTTATPKAPQTPAGPTGQAGQTNAPAPTAGLTPAPTAGLTPAPTAGLTATPAAGLTPTPVTEPTPPPAPAPASTLTPVPTATPGSDPAEVLVRIPDGTGHGFIEGNPAPVSQETIDRLSCTNGTVQLSFDTDGQPLNLGREQRLFTQAQRLALAARDGGCIWGDCSKPPSQTEAHHLEHWAKDHGSTDIRLGVLLCPPHHLLLHNQGWQILEHNGTYWLRPPATVDPGQQLIRLRSKSAAAHEQHDHPTDQH